MLNFPIFVFVFYAVALVAIFEYFASNKRFDFYAGAALTFFFVLFIGLRGNFDSDYDAYVGIYDQVNFYTHDAFIASFSLNVEVLFVFLIAFLKSMHLSAIALFIVCAFISLFTSWRYCLKKIRYPSLVILGLYSHSFLYREFTQIRHGIASAICVASFFFLGEKKYKTAIGIQLVAALFHSGVLFVLFVTILFVLLSNRSFLIVFLCVSMTVFIVKIQGLLLLLDAIVAVPSSVMIYLGAEQYNYSLGLLNVTLLKQAIFLLIFSYFYVHFKVSDKRYLDLLILYSVSVMWLFGANSFAMFAGRLASFFGLIEVYLVVMALPYISGRGFRHLYVALVIVFYFVQFHLNIVDKRMFNADYYLGFTL